MNAVPLPTVKATPNQNANIAALFPDSMRPNGQAIVRPSVPKNKSQFQYNANQEKPFIPVTSPMPPEVALTSAETSNAEKQSALDAMDVQIETTTPLKETDIEDDYNLSQIIHQHFETKKAKKIQEEPKAAAEELKPNDEEQDSTKKTSIQPSALFKEKVKNAAKEKIAKHAEEKAAEEKLVNSNVSIPPLVPMIAPNEAGLTQIDSQVSIKKVRANCYVLYIDGEDVEVLFKRRKI